MTDLWAGTADLTSFFRSLVPHKEQTVAFEKLFLQAGQ